MLNGVTVDYDLELGTNTSSSICATDQQQHCFAAAGMQPLQANKVIADVILTLAPPRGKVFCFNFVSTCVDESEHFP